MKRFIWPLIHSFKFNPNICNNHWGWMTQNEIKNISQKKIPKGDNIKLDLYNFNPIDDDEFINGTIIGYKTIYNSYFDKIDFLDHDYTQPELSIALNHLMKYNNYDKIELKSINSKILGKWYEIGISKMNSNFLGLYDINIIKEEIVTGGIGPEIENLWDKKPMKEKIKVLYQIDNKLDVWEWERCLYTDDSNWCVSNINQIII